MVAGRLVVVVVRRAVALGSIRVNGIPLAGAVRSGPVPARSAGAAGGGCRAAAGALELITPRSPPPPVARLPPLTTSNKELE